MYYLIFGHVTASSTRRVFKQKGTGATDLLKVCICKNVCKLKIRRKQMWELVVLTACTEDRECAKIKHGPSMSEFASIKIQCQTFVPQCAKYWENSMQIGEFIIRTDLQSLKPVAETFYLFSASERQAFIDPPLLFADLFIFFYFFLYVNILFIFCCSSYFFAEQ